MVKKIGLLILLVFMLCSCYTQKIILNADKNSGQIIINYELNDDTLQLFSIIADNFSGEMENPLDPVALIDEDMFREYFQETKDIKLKKVSIVAGDVYTGEIVIQFKNLEELLAKLPEGVTNLDVKREDNKLTFSQVINFKEMDPDGIFKQFIQQQKEDDINFYNQLTKESVFNFQVKSKTPVKYTEGVSLSKDKKTASYTFKIVDLIENYDKIMKFIVTL